MGCLKKKGTYKNSKHQHAGNTKSDQESSEGDNDLDLTAVSIHSVNNHESCEVFAPLVFHSKDLSSQSCEIWTSEIESLMVWWASEISLSSLVSDNLQSKTISQLKTAW